MYIFFNPNPERRSTGDCVIRAISKITGKSWEDVYIGVCLQGLLLHDMPDMNHIWSEYLYHQGLVRDVIPNTCPNCYTVKDFCYDHPFGSYLLACGKHVVAVKDGNYYDAWDSGDEVPLYYWRYDPRLT
jgi:hypothetical protein